MKKFIFAVVVLVTAFCFVEKYYRSQTSVQKTEVATSSKKSEMVKKSSQAPKTVTLEISGVKSSFAP